MRAIHALGILHKASGKSRKLEGISDNLPEMPHDNQGIRHLAAELDQAPAFSM